MTVVLCADVGSTYTKVAAVDADSGRLYATASHRTTLERDVLDGVEAAEARLNLPSGVEITQRRVCSSAGGGLRLGVIGNEPLVTATAAHRAGLSAGARVVCVLAGLIAQSDMDRLARAGPDVLLLAGGTDGGDTTVLLEHARRLAEVSTVEKRLRVPVVLAGNAAAAEPASEVLREAGMTVSVVSNVLPRIGTLDPGPARSALRDVFLRHVIAGKHLSAQDEFASMVRSATPDTVLSGVELLADGHGQVAAAGDLVVVDVGGATTDVYSVLAPDAELAGPRREVAGTAWRSRTVEGDLGVRHTATGVVAAAVDERLVDTAEAAELEPAAQQRVASSDWLPDTDAQIAVDLRLTQLAISIALRRHARGERLGGERSPLRGGKDLRQVALVVGSGGVLRHHGEAALDILDSAVRADTAGGYPLPENPKIIVDMSYVLAAAGLLADDHPRAAATLLERQLISPS